MTNNTSNRSPSEDGNVLTQPFWSIQTEPKSPLEGYSNMIIINLADCPKNIIRTLSDIFFNQKHLFSIRGVFLSRKRAIIKRYQHLSAKILFALNGALCYRKYMKQF